MTDGLVLAARIAGVGVGFPLLSGFFGSSVLGRLTRLDREERLAASFGVGFAAQGLVAFLAFVLHAPQPYFNLGAVALMLGTALLCHLSTGRRPAEAPVWPLVAVFALAYLHLVCIQAILPAYRGSYWYFDWWMHYDEALVFVGDEPVTTVWAGSYTVASRTPLFNLATAFVMGLAGHDFAVYQLASALTNICFVLALAVLLRDLFGRRAAWLALLLAPLNVWMLHNAWFTWPKMLAAYYLVLALHFYLQSLRRRRADPAGAADYFVGFGAFALLAFMTHQSTLVYALPLILHAAVMAIRGLRPAPREWLACALVAAAVGGPWYAWLAGTLGTDKILHSTPVTRGDESAVFRPAAIADWMRCNLRDSVVPDGIRTALLTPVPDGEEPPPRSIEVSGGEPRWFLGLPDLVELHRGVTQLYFSLLTGAVTLSLTVFLAAALARRLLGGRRLPAAKEPTNGPAVWAAVWACLAVGTLGGAFLHPGKIPWGIAHSAVFPTTVVLTGLAWGVLSRARPVAAVLVGCGMVLEFLLMFWSHWWLLFHDPDVLDPGTGARGAHETWVPLLNEALGDADRLFLAGAGLIQAALIVLLLRALRQAPVAKEAA